MIMAGAVAHFVDTKMIRHGLHEDVSGVQSRLTAATNEFQKLPEPATKLSKEEMEAATKARRFVSESLALCQAALTRIQQQYALSQVERAVLEQIAAAKQAEFRKQLEAAGQPNKKRGSQAPTVGANIKDGQRQKGEAPDASSRKPGDTRATLSETPNPPLKPQEAEPAPTD
jgi:hypothetical protein